MYQNDTVEEVLIYKSYNRNKNIRMKTSKKKENIVNVHKTERIT